MRKEGAGLRGMAGFYAVFHGQDGIRATAKMIHSKAATLSAGIKSAGYNQINDSFFDTISFEASEEQLKEIEKKCNGFLIIFAQWLGMKIRMQVIH